MARNTVSIDQIVNDFILTSDGDDYVNNANGVVVRNYALRGIREMGFDIQNKIIETGLNMVFKNSSGCG